MAVAVIHARRRAALYVNEQKPDAQDTGGHRDRAGGGNDSHDITE